MRRLVKAIEKDAQVNVRGSYIYQLSCGHSVTGDLRHKRQGKRVQPKTAVCEFCPSVCHPKVDLQQP